MPTKILFSQTDRKGLQDTFKFGGGKNTIIANDDDTSTYGYIIDGGGGDDTITGSDFSGLGIFDPTADARTKFGDVLIGGFGSDTITGGAGDDTIYGGNEDGSDGGKGKDPVVSNELVGDTRFESVADGFTFGSDDIFGGNGVSNSIYGDNFGTLTLGSGAVITGGDDELVGGNGLADEFLFNNLIGDSQFLSAGGGAGFTGGNDTLTGGSGVAGS